MPPRGERERALEMVHFLASVSEAGASGVNLLVNPGIIEPFAVLASIGLGMRAETLARELGSNSHPAPGDIRSAQTVRALVADIVERFGGRRGSTVYFLYYLPAATPLGATGGAGG